MNSYPEKSFGTYSLVDGPPVMYPISQNHYSHFEQPEPYISSQNNIPESVCGYAMVNSTDSDNYDTCYDLVNTPDTYAYTVSPASTATDEGSTSSSAQYYYSAGGYGESFVMGGSGDKVCAPADSSSQTPPKPKKRRSPEIQQRQRNAANERERRRMMSINKAFEGLRSRIPTLPYEKRLSKVDTLRLTIGYIHILEDLLRNDDEMRANSGIGAGGENSTSTISSRHSQTPYGRSGSHLRQPPLKKVIIECHSTGSSYENEMLGVSPVRAHSLSWNRQNESNMTSSNPTLTAKLWFPQVSSSSRDQDPTFPAQSPQYSTPSTGP